MDKNCSIMSEDYVLNLTILAFSLVKGLRSTFGSVVNEMLIPTVSVYWDDRRIILLKQGEVRDVVKMRVGCDDDVDWPFRMIDGSLQIINFISRRS